MMRSTSSCVRPCGPLPFRTDSFPVSARTGGAQINRPSTTNTISLFFCAIVRSRILSPSSVNTTAFLALLSARPIRSGRSAQPAFVANRPGALRTQHGSKAVTVPARSVSCREESRQERTTRQLVQTRPSIPLKTRTPPGASHRHQPPANTTRSAAKHLHYPRRPYAIESSKALDRFKQ